MTVQLEESGASTPLLVDFDDAIQGASKPGRTPLPKFQLFMLCLIMLAEPVAHTQIFPYVNDLCLKLGYAKTEKEVGFISGLIDSLFAIMQLATVMQWGRLSDRIGRRPVLILGLIGLTVPTLLFGLSKTLWLTILARCLAGALCGNGAVCQSMISELTDETNEAQGFALISLMWATGCILGPTIGGSLSRPAEQLPNLFGGVKLWETYPYLLPCVVSACFTALPIIVAVFLLKETLPAKVREEKRVSSSSPSYGTMAEQVNEEDAIPSTWTILRSPAMPEVLISTFLMMFTNQAWDVVFILYAYTSIKLGGLSMSNPEIGYCLAGAGCVGACIQMFIFPRMQRRFGMRMYPYLMSILVLMFVGAPILNRLVGLYGTEPARGDVVSFTFVGVGLLLLLGRIAAMIFPLTFILMKKAAPNKKAMATTYGLSAFTTASARAGAPWFVSSLFAWSAQTKLLGGCLIWVVMSVIVVGAVILSLRLPSRLQAADRAKKDKFSNSHRGEG